MGALILTETLKLAYFANILYITFVSASIWHIFFCEIPNDMERKWKNKKIMHLKDLNSLILGPLYQRDYIKIK